MFSFISASKIVPIILPILGMNLTSFLTFPNSGTLQNDYWQATPCNTGPNNVLQYPSNVATFTLDSPEQPLNGAYVFRLLDSSGGQCVPNLTDNSLGVPAGNYFFRFAYRRSATGTDEPQFNFYYWGSNNNTTQFTTNLTVATGGQWIRKSFFISEPSDDAPQIYFSVVSSQPGQQVYVDLDEVVLQRTRASSCGTNGCY